MSAPSTAGGDRSGGGRVAWYHCFAGLAGDMALAALIDAGAPVGDVRAVLDALRLPGWRLRTEAVVRGGIGATRVVVEVDDDRPARRLPELLGLVTGADLPPRVARRAVAALRTMAEAEGAVHRRPATDVHLHELGGHDTIVDVVGTAAALELLDVDRVEASPVAVGTGTVRSSHGPLPNPAPAVLALLQGAPLVGRPTEVELTTPTGAALLAAWAERFGPMPPLVLRHVGYGAGTAELADLPNCVQVAVGDPQPDGGGRAGDGEQAEDVVLLETTVDDVTGEVLGHTVAALLEAGALDAWCAPVVMKQGRPGHVVSALVSPGSAVAARRVLQAETGTLGVRVQPLRRWVVPRHASEVTLDGHRLAVKVGPDRVKAEHRDVVRVAGLLGRPAREVALAAEAAWHGQHPGR